MKIASYAPARCAGAFVCASPKAPSTKRGLAERSEVWGSLKNFSPLIAFGDLSPLYEEGGLFAAAD